MDLLCYHKCLITTLRYIIRMGAQESTTARLVFATLLVFVFKGIDTPTSLLLKERDTIIERFRAKKRRRVWKKKIRYHCRKNLADRRVRVKGRFVRRGSEGATDAEEVAPSPSADGSLEGEEDDLEDEDTDGENDPGPTEEEPSTSSSASSSSAKRSRIYDKAGEKKQKKPKRVLFDESVVDNSDNTSTAVSSTTGSGGNSSASSLQEDGDNLNLVGGQRMRRHSIAY